MIDPWALPDLSCVDGPERVHCHHWWEGGTACCHCWVDPVHPEVMKLVKEAWWSTTPTRL